MAQEVMVATQRHAFLFALTVTVGLSVSDKTFVHEWSHLRWGLFDEYAIDEENKFQTRRKKLYPIQCVLSTNFESIPCMETSLPLGLYLPFVRCVDGRNGVIKDSETGGGCVFDKKSGLPTSSCKFVPDYDSQYKASIMYAEYLSSVSISHGTTHTCLTYCSILHNIVSNYM